MSTRMDARLGGEVVGGLTALTWGNTFWNGWNDFARSPGECTREVFACDAPMSAPAHTHAHGPSYGRACSTRSNLVNLGQAPSREDHR